MKTVKIGLLVASAIVILMVGIYLMPTSQHFWVKKAKFEIHFSRVNGLEKAAPVSLAGVNIGSVESIEFPDDPKAGWAVVEIRVEAKNAAPRIHTDAVATIRTFGMLGDRYIDLSGGNPNSPPLPPGSIMKSKDPGDYEALLNESLKSIAEITNKINTGKGTLGRLVNDPSLYNSVKKTVEGLDESGKAAAESLDSSPLLHPFGLGRKKKK